MVIDIEGIHYRTVQNFGVGKFWRKLSGKNLEGKILAKATW